MKTIMIILTVVSLMLISFVPETTSEKENKKVVQRFAESIVDAFKNESPESFAGLFPSVSDFKKLMEINREPYGPYLKEAQEEFAKEYSQSLLPRVREAFMALVAEGKKRNVDWKNIEITKVEVGVESPEPSVSISFASNNVTYKLILEKVILVNGQLKVTQFVKLI